jgi:phage baseplate assembly protein W
VTFIDFPFSFDDLGHTARTVRQNHRRDMLIQYLLTLQGERVNRPDFGTPLFRMCFENNSNEIAEVIKLIVKAGVQRYLGEQIDVTELTVVPIESSLQVDLQYIIIGEPDPQRFSRRYAIGGGVPT